MLLMATCRKKRKGEYSDEEQIKYRFDYLYGHKGGPVGEDGFVSPHGPVA